MTAIVVMASGGGGGGGGGDGGGGGEGIRLSRISFSISDAISSDIAHNISSSTDHSNGLACPNPRRHQRVAVERSYFFVLDR